MLLENIGPGDEVAILLSTESRPDETIEIAEVEYVDRQIVRLTDDRVYSRFSRCGLTHRSYGFIEPATSAHHVAIEWAAVET
jgi:hypothetical protein